LDDFGNFLHRAEIARARNRKAGLDDVDAHLVKQFGDPQFLFMRHRRAWRLLAVAQGGVEDGDVLQWGGHEKSPSLRRAGALVSPVRFSPKHEARKARPM